LFEQLCPKMVVDKIEHIDLDELKTLGLNYILLDLDNTLCSWKKSKLSESVSNWLNDAIQSGFSLCVISNSLLKWKVKRMGREIGIPAINCAGKPRKKGFMKALNLINAETEKTVIIGDQVFTDVWGGNRLGLYTILVKPIDKREFMTTFFQRNCEKILLQIWKKKGILKPVASEENKFVRVIEGY